MKVFISWSGDQSRAIAEALRAWLPKVIQSLKPWMSSQDIRKGARWQSEIGDQLEASDFGIVCLTQSNLEAPWILFESGALAKKLVGSHLCTYLAGVSVADVAEPLRQFQATHAKENDTLRLLETMNAVQPDGQLPSEDLKEAFAVWWPKLEKALADLKPESDAPPATTSLEQIAKGVDELLQLVRASKTVQPNLGLPFNPKTSGLLGALYGKESENSDERASTLAALDILSREINNRPKVSVTAPSLAAPVAREQP